MPSCVPGYNQPCTEGVSGTWWMCNGTQIWPLPGNTPPTGTQAWKTFSVFFSGGYGFRVMNGNATTPTDGEVYHPLAFEHHNNDNCSSYLTNVMQQPTLRCHRNQVWTRMLLPNTYHGPVTAVQQYGGLKGELPIFLALVAFSMPPELLATYLSGMMHNGVWQQFNMQNGCTYLAPCTDCAVPRLTHPPGIHKRGVVATVYTFPNGSPAADLRRSEEGEGQRYYA